MRLGYTVDCEGRILADAEGGMLKTMRGLMVSSGNLVAEDKWRCGRCMVGKLGKWKN